jgi:hypothetical protein
MIGEDVRGLVALWDEVDSIVPKWESGEKKSCASTNSDDRIRITNEIDFPLY